ncbi:MAG: OmpA family protein [Campylobacterales bacterium]|nr:OmpA family protein [Campylobacterales bacterium]
MAKKKDPCNCPKCLPNWLAAFGDLMSLLLCFFVLLLSMSTMDAKKVQEAIGSLAGALSVLEGGTKTEISRERQQQATPIEQQEETTQMVKTLARTITDVNEMLKATGSPEVTLEESEDGFIIRLPSNLLFRPGSAAIDNDDAILFLIRIAMVVQQLPEDLHINARGHTDNTPPAQDSPFRDNWELSSARAVSVIKELLQNNIKPERVVASGKSSYEPLASNATAEGRAKNRRVDLHFYSLNKDNKGAAQQSVLDQQGAQ